MKRLIGILAIALCMGASSAFACVEESIRASDTCDFIIANKAATPRVRAEAYRDRAIAKSPIDLPGAYQDLDAAIELDPSNATLYATRGMFRKADGKPFEAEDDYQHAHELAPKNADYALALADLVGEHDEAAALRLLDEALVTSADKASVRTARAQLLFDHDHYEEALAEYGKLEQYPDREAVAVMMRGYVLTVMGNADAAIKELTRSLVLSQKPSSLSDRSTESITFGLRAFNYYAEDRYPEALADTTQSIVLNDMWPVRQVRGMIFLRQKKYAEAFKEFDHVIKTNAEIASSYYLRAEANHLLGKKAIAQRDIAQGIMLETGLKKIKH